MATAKFKTESPYVKIDEREHHATDWRHTRYLKGLALGDGAKAEGQKATAKVVHLALFGLGRAGTIHLNNLLANR